MMTSLLDLPSFTVKRDVNGRRRQWFTPARLTGLANLGGAALISYGIGMILPAAGVIAGGVLLVLLGKAASMPSLPR